MSTPDPECSECHGTGLVERDPTPPHPPSFSRCECVLRQDILANVERGMTGLSRAPVISGSALVGQHTNNLWVTADDDFLSHLRHVAVRRPATWLFRVVSDAELVTAWLASIALKGGEIIDPDAYMVSTKYLTVPDLVEPPDLVVIRMGIKVARNAAASEVLAEALNTRLHAGKPTWLWDGPMQPLTVGHLFHSPEVERALNGWTRLRSLAPSTSSEGGGGEESGGTPEPGELAPQRETTKPGWMTNKTFRGSDS